ncbi:MAG: hypothetical protein FWH27_19485, partial [Planctomycetaceae bacterium]|nr:hypothetical protein [Planctomycetaceae bacterium]
PGKHDGNIKDCIGAYFFSKAPAPFENNQGYSICDLFAGVLFGDIGKSGRAKFAERYLQSAPSDSSQSDNASTKPDKPSRVIRSFDEISTEPPEWFLYNKIPANDISIIKKLASLGSILFS